MLLDNNYCDQIVSLSLDLNDFKDIMAMEFSNNASLKNRCSGAVG